MHPGHLVAISALCASCGFSVTTATGDLVPDGGSDATVDAPSGVCSTAGLACANPGVTLACGAACWVGCRESTTYAVAKERCQQWGGELARIDTQEVQQCVNATFAGSARWLGLEQAPGSSQRTTGWSWGGDGLALPYVNWAAGQPNDSDGNENGEEQCAYLSNPGGGWHDMPCDQSTGAFICRRP